MYTKSMLNKYDYFKQQDLNIILDSLTGTVSRGYILEFIHKCIDLKKEFSIGIFDIDNFKLVNDSYGHQIGDIVLKTIGSSLIEAVGSNGVVGRYGGDEFIIVSFNEITYDSTWQVFKKIYDDHMRKEIMVDDTRIFVTATTGIARFPSDASLFDELFLKADKALYRGKQKGRNCFIVYLDEKHKNIDLSKNKQSMIVVIEDIQKRLTKEEDIKNRLKSTFRYVSDLYSLSAVYYFENNGKILSEFKRDNYLIEPINKEILDVIFKDKNFEVCNDYSIYKTKNKELHEYCWKNKIKAFILCRVVYNKEEYGYVLFCDYGLKRIWQDYETLSCVTITNSISLIMNYKKR